MGTPTATQRRGRAVSSGRRGYDSGGQGRRHTRRPLHERQPRPLPRRGVWGNGTQQHDHGGDVVVGPICRQRRLDELLRRHPRVSMGPEVSARESHRRLRLGLGLGLG